MVNGKADHTTSYKGMNEVGSAMHVRVLSSVVVDWEGEGGGARDSDAESEGLLWVGGKK
jgi:hypothetical protein